MSELLRVHTLSFETEQQAEAAKRVVQSRSLISEVGELAGSPVLQFVTEERIEQVDRSRIDFCAHPVRSVFNVVLD